MTVAPLVWDHGTSTLREMSVTELAALGGGSVPLDVAAGVTFSVTANTQVLFRIPIRIEGIIHGDGALVYA